MNTVTVQHQQTLLDLAIQYCGSVDAAYNMALLNNLTIDAPLRPGQTITIPAPLNNVLVQELLRRGVEVASGVVEVEEEEEPEPEPEFPKYGALYNWWAYSEVSPWPQAMLAMEGWGTLYTVPNSLISSAGGSSEAGLRLKSTREFPAPHPRWNEGVVATNELQFNVHGSGFRGSWGFLNLGNSARIWRAGSSLSGHGSTHDFSRQFSNVNLNNVPENSGCSVRLVRVAPYSEEIDGIKKTGEYCAPYYDYEGNPYRTVRIGDRVYLADNLRTEFFRDGTPIPIVADQQDWQNLSTPGMCYYNNNKEEFA